MRCIFFSGRPIKLNFLFRFSFSVTTGRFSQVYVKGGYRKNFQNHMRLAEQFLRVIGGFLYAATNSLKRIASRIFRQVILKKPRKTICLLFSPKPQSKN
jgi:hypothetical protein